MFDVFELHRQLVASARPSSLEQTGIAQALTELVRPYVDEVFVGGMDNMICHKKGPGKKVMLSAHMDAIGFIVTRIDKDGFVYINTVGHHNAAQVVNCRVRFLNGVKGVIRPRNSAENTAGTWSEMSFDKVYLDIGASCYEEAAALIRIGDMALFEGEPRRVAGNRVMGPYADDLIGCVALLRTMEQVKESDYDIYCVFSSQEEVGCRGARSAAQIIEPDIAIACDVCGTGDTPDRDRNPRVLSIGKGPTLKLRDDGVYCTPGLNARLREIAEQNGIPTQVEMMFGGHTDTMPMQQAVPTVEVTGVSILTRHIHSPAETYDITDVEQTAALLAAFLNH